VTVTIYNGKRGPNFNPFQPRSHRAPTGLTGYLKSTYEHRSSAGQSSRRWKMRGKNRRAVLSI